MGIIAGATYREGVAYSPDGAMYVTLASGGTISSTSLSQTLLNSNVRTVIQQGGVPLVCPGTMTVGNNGAITLGTAMNVAHGNFYIYLQAGDIAAGVPAAAGFYYAQASSTTAVIAFNNLWSGTGAPPFITSPTAFVTTGPGSRTGDTGAEVTFQTTIPVLAANSQILLTLNSNPTNTAGTKTYTIKLGASTFHTVTANSVGRASGVFHISNIGATNKNLAQYGVLSGFTVSTQEAMGTIDTSATSTLSVTVQRGTATDNLILLPPIVEVAY